MRVVTWTHRYDVLSLVTDQLEWAHLMGAHEETTLVVDRETPLGVDQGYGGRRPLKEMAQTRRRLGALQVAGRRHGGGARPLGMSHSDSSGVRACPPRAERG